MALEEERNSRDYLYGRLLAVAEKLESMALYFANEKRETTAARLMQRFADRPFSTWLTIETSLTPYKSRINSKNPGLLKGYMELIDRICSQFQIDEFKQDSRLSGEFLLSYHCQRKWLNEHKREKGQWVSKTDDDAEDQDTYSKE
jgi:CRISPR-associated protein Csd1